MCMPDSGIQKEGARLLSVVSSDRTRGIKKSVGYPIQTLKRNKKTQKQTKKTQAFAVMDKHWNMLPGEAVKSPFLETLKTQRGTVLGNLL